MTKESRERQEILILTAAMKVISERGLPETRMADIAAEIGVSAPSLLHWFSTKDELLAQALAFADRLLFERVQDELVKEESSIRQLDWFIRHNMGLGGGGRDGWRQNWNLWIEVWARSLHDDVVAAAGKAQAARWRELVTDIVRRGRSRGEFSAGNPDDFAVLLLSLMDGLAVQLALKDARVGRKRAVQMCLDLMNGSLAPRSREVGRKAVKTVKKADDQRSRDLAGRRLSQRVST
jgi:AcrR family transcriptional regulator